MNNPLLHFVQFLTFQLKSGHSVEFALSSYKKLHLPLWNKLHLSKGESLVPYTSVEYELSLVLNKGVKGFPVTRSLESIQKKACEAIDFKIEEHSKKAPFLALIPLFLFQVPSLGIVFFYPLISQFLEELR